MNKYFFILLMLASAPFYSLKSNAQCKPKPLVKSAKQAMKPFSTDAYTDNELIFGKLEKTIETPFTAYSGESYRLLFIAESVPQEFKVSVYDKNKRAKTRKELYSKTFSAGGTQTLEPFDIKKPGNYYIQVDVPKSADSTSIKKACFITIIGFKEND